MNRCKLLLCTTMIVGSIAVFSGPSRLYAEPAQPTAKEQAAAERALAKRAELLKRREEARKFLQQVMEGQASLESSGNAAPGASAPLQPDKGGAK